MSSFVKYVLSACGAEVEIAATVGAGAEPVERVAGNEERRARTAHAPAEVQLAFDDGHDLVVGVRVRADLETGLELDLEQLELAGQPVVQAHRRVGDLRSSEPLLQRVGIDVDRLHELRRVRDRRT